MGVLVVIADVHGEFDRLQRTLELVGEVRASVALLVGDLALDPPRLSPARERERDVHDESVRRVVSTVGEALRCPVVFVPGNHDLPEPPPDTNGINADGRVVEIAGLSIAGLGGSGPAHHGFPYEWNEQEAAAKIETMLGDRRSVDLFLFHAPPVNTSLDRLWTGGHVGSSAIANAIERARPRLLLCGHIHEAWGVECVSGAPCINAGALGDPYAQEIAWIVDWNAGPARIQSRRILTDGSVERKDWSW